MKKYLIILLVLLGLTSCIKQKDCDCESVLLGKFVYYETPEEVSYCGDLQKINAIIINDFTEPPYQICGSIPKEYQVKDTINVRVCLKLWHKGNCTVMGIGAIYNITCIEKEE